MGPQAKGMQVGGAIALAVGAVFLVRWWMRPVDPAWSPSADGLAWVATRDCNGALLLPERTYLLSGDGSAPASVSWTLRSPEEGDSERTGAAGRAGDAGTVQAGTWSLKMRMGTEAPRRASATVRVSPAASVRPESLRIELAR